MTNKQEVESSHSTKENLTGTFNLIISVFLKKNISMLIKDYFLKLKVVPFKYNYSVG